MTSCADPDIKHMNPLINFKPVIGTKDGELIVILPIPVSDCQNQSIIYWGDYTAAWYLHVFPNRWPWPN